jgi:hypothetical protein
LVNGFGADEDGRFNIRGIVVNKDIEFSLIYKEVDKEKEFSGYIQKKNISGYWK